MLYQKFNEEQIDYKNGTTEKMKIFKKFIMIKKMFLIVLNVTIFYFILKMKKFIIVHSIMNIMKLMKKQSKINQVHLCVILII